MNIINSKVIIEFQWKPFSVLDEKESTLLRVDSLLKLLKRFAGFGSSSLELKQNNLMRQHWYLSHLLLYLGLFTLYMHDCMRRKRTEVPRNRSWPTADKKLNSGKLSIGSSENVLQYEEKKRTLSYKTVHVDRVQ